MITFKSERLRKEFSDDITDRLRFILYAVDGYSVQHYRYGIRITELIRTPEENEAVDGVFNSKHLANKDDKAEAADFVYSSGRVPLDWDDNIKAFIGGSLWGVDVVITPHGTGVHVHLECDPKPPDKPVVIV